MTLQESKDLIEQLTYCYNRINDAIDDRFILETIELIAKNKSGVYHRDLRFKSEIWSGKVYLLYSEVSESLDVLQIDVIFDNTSYTFFNNEVMLSNNNKTIGGYNFKLKECMIHYNNQLTLVSVVNDIHEMEIPVNYQYWDEEILTLVRLSF